ncbi:AbrB family transcriptional regulator [Paracoccus sp. S-4012]|uniref:AbrB family transcriptional regulator n=1 Tax=Paracoccus sp. S-4012 TaxID=2665648 RepID=UPI0012AFDDF7|nr:AbrB family transcriptional regulator [Paracoccus sp. S-4012]MRX48941.1 AbrB family transcriptional regulator [Paracoccus sp. S-4012]
MGRRERLRQRALTLAAAAAGVALFQLLGLPLPFLFGPMFACLAAALAGWPLMGMGRLSVAARAVLGVAVGASLTPAVVSLIPNMLGSVALMPVYIVAIAAVGVPFFQRFGGYDRVTAFFAAMPGGAADMVIFGEAAGGDTRALSLIHATRVLVIVVVVPIVLTQVYGATLINPIGAPLNEVPLVELLLMIFAGALGWLGAERVGLFGAAVLGPLIVAGVLSMAGLIHVRPPREAMMAAQFLIGLGIGVQYVGVTLRELRRTVTLAAAFMLLLAALAGIFTEIVVLTGLAPPVEGFLAFAPGGQAEMVTLAIIAGADLGFVVTHHLVRVMLVLLGAPLVMRGRR